MRALGVARQLINALTAWHAVFVRAGAGALGPLHNRRAERRRRHGQAHLGGEHAGDARMRPADRFQLEPQPRAPPPAARSPSEPPPLPASRGGGGGGGAGARRGGHRAAPTDAQRARLRPGAARLRGRGAAAPRAARAPALGGGRGAGPRAAASPGQRRGARPGRPAAAAAAPGQPPPLRLGGAAQRPARVLPAPQARRPAHLGAVHPVAPLVRLEPGAQRRPRRARGRPRRPRAARALAPGAPQEPQQAPPPRGMTPAASFSTRDSNELARGVSFRASMRRFFNVFEGMRVPVRDCASACMAVRTKEWNRSSCVATRYTYI